MGRWEVVDNDKLLEDADLINVKWVFKIKVQKWRVRATQGKNRCFWLSTAHHLLLSASFSPTAPYVTIRLVLAHTALLHWYGVDLDASTFVSAPLTPEKQLYLKGIVTISLR